MGRSPTTGRRQHDRRNAGFAIAAVLFGAACAPVHPDPDPPREVGRAERAPLAIPPLPENRHGHRAEFLGDGSLLVFGGFDDADRSGDRGGRTSWILAPGSDSWTRTGDLPHAMQFHGSCTLGGQVYAVSGDVARYEAEAGTWQVVVHGDALPKSHFAAARVGARIVAAGGFVNAIADLASGAVTLLPDYPGRSAQDHFALVAALDARVHVAGGYGGENFDVGTQHWAFDGERWIPRAPLPRPVAAKFAAWAADPVMARLYAFDVAGGLVYDARWDAWGELPAPPWSGYLVMPACVVHDGYLYVLGGSTPDGGTHDASIFDLRALTWMR